MRWLPAVLLLAALSARAEPELPVHGLWVWKSAAVLAAPHGALGLQQFCKTEGISEIYLSFSAHLDAGEEGRFANLIAALHGSRTRVEALISSADADQPGAPRAKLLSDVRRVLEFNANHSGARFDGIHLDIEPQQRPENKGTGNLRFLDDLLDAYRSVAALTQGRGLSINADIQVKLLKSDLEQRRTLLTALPRLTLMLYELSNPADGSTQAQRQDKLRDRTAEAFRNLYEGLPSQDLAKMAIALRTADYAEALPAMLASLDQMNRANPHYLGWARHSYNDVAAP
jgi:hypothetical protein